MGENNIKKVFGVCLLFFLCLLILLLKSSVAFAYGTAAEGGDEFSAPAASDGDQEIALPQVIVLVR